MQSHGTTLVLLAAIICGISVYMALDLRKKLNMVESVLQNINKAAEDAVTKADLEGLKCAENGMLGGGPACALAQKTKAPTKDSTTGDDDAEPSPTPVAVHQVEEMVILPKLQPAKRPRLV
tara:strand:+ start:1877 stop:2239 length:363 start_codon:yes stop_codon:yes gene_type:complete